MRYTKEVRFRFVGPRETCVKYISTARKLLGQLDHRSRFLGQLTQDTHRVTLPDGTRIAVNTNAIIPIVIINVTGTKTTSSDSRFVTFAIFPPYSGPGNTWDEDTTRATWEVPPAIDTLAAIMQIDTQQRRVVLADRERLIDTYGYSEEVGEDVSFRHNGQLDWVDADGNRLYVSTTQPASKYNLRRTDRAYTAFLGGITQKNKLKMAMPTTARTCLGMGMFHGHLVYVTTVAAQFVARSWESPVQIRAVPAMFDDAGELQITGDVYLVAEFYQKREEYGLAATRDHEFDVDNNSGNVSPESYDSPQGTDWFCFSPDGSLAVRNKSFPQGKVEREQTEFTSSGAGGNLVRHQKWEHITWHESFRERLRFEFDEPTQKVIAFRGITPNAQGPVMHKTWVLDENNSESVTDLNPDTFPGIYNHYVGTKASEQNDTYVLEGALEEVVAYDYDNNNQLVTLTLVHKNAATYHYERSFSEAYDFSKYYSVIFEGSSSGGATESWSGRHDTVLRVYRGETTYDIPYYKMSISSASGSSSGRVDYADTNHSETQGELSQSARWTDNSVDFSNVSGFTGSPPKQLGVACMDLRNGYIVTTLLHTDATDTFSSASTVRTGSEFPDGVERVETRSGEGVFDSRREDVLYVCTGDTLVSAVLPRIGGTDNRPVYETTMTLPPVSGFFHTPVQKIVDRVAGVDVVSLGGVESPASDGTIYAALVNGIGGSLAVDPVTGVCAFSVASIDLTLEGATGWTKRLATCSQALYMYDPVEGVVTLTDLLWPGHNMKRNNKDTVQYGLVGFVEAVITQL